MTQQALNGMLTIMLAKFLLNDVPHAMGMYGTRLSWIVDAWRTLCDDALPYGLNINERMSKAIIDDNIDPASIKTYKMLLGGFYSMFKGTASDEMVNDMYCTLKNGIKWGKNYISRTEGMSFDNALKFYRREYGVPEEREPLLLSEDMGYLGVLEGIAYVDRLYINGTRLDKVVAIDSTMYVVHTTEGILQFVLPVRWGESIAYLIADTLDWIRVRKS